MDKKKLIYFLLMFLPLVITLFALPFLPEMTPAHYNFEGEVDRWGSKYENLIFPAVTVGMGLFMLWMAKISAKDENGEKNEKVVFYTGMGLSVWFTVMHCYFLFMEFKNATNLNDFEIDINRLFCIVMGIGLMVFGKFMPKLKRNSLIGLRTGWSMKNDETWEKSQAFGGALFIVGGLLMVISAFVFKGIGAMFVSLGILILCAVSGTVYSYKIAKKY